RFIARGIEDRDGAKCLIDEKTFRAAYEFWNQLGDVVTKSDHLPTCAGRPVADCFESRIVQMLVEFSLVAFIAPDLAQRLFTGCQVSLRIPHQLSPGEGRMSCIAGCNVWDGFHHAEGRKRGALTERQEQHGTADEREEVLGSKSALNLVRST
ncbi:hypothetical protein G3M58_87375, partial [Streptomyces sp. SID7499]|nr:hypothetical protein [Streptomyces sp. SID7499]